MKTIMIIGWYGTETIGDRAILASLFKNLFELNKNIKLIIGSIYPFHTQLTLIEDNNFYIEICNMPKDAIINCEIIDTRNLFELQKGIKKSDIIIIGGGPFDEMASMYMLQYAFKYAKKLNKITMIYGCGSNILKSTKIKKAARDIVNYSDLVFLRDVFSKEILEEIRGIHLEKAHILIDPAVFSVLAYKEKNRNDEKSSYIAINLRDFPNIYRVEKNNKVNINDKCFNIIKKLGIDNEEIKLVPMHYFDIGGDDRIILEQLKNHLGKNTLVYNKPLSLEETLSCFYHANYCIGMRFHSVVLQTILNGNNYILNYTAPKKGKIPGFIKQINGENFYKSRYINLQDINDDETLQISNESFKCDEILIKNYENIYKTKIGEWLNV